MAFNTFLAISSALLQLLRDDDDGDWRLATG